MTRGEVIIIMRALAWPDKETLERENWPRNKITLGPLDNDLYIAAHKSKYLKCVRGGGVAPGVTARLMDYEVKPAGILWVQERFDQLKQRGWLNHE